MNDVEQMVGFKEEIRIIGGQHTRVLVRAVYNCYQLLVQALAVGATLQASIQLQAEADFLLEGFTYMADVAGGAQTDSTRVIPLVRAQLLENNVSLFNQPVDVSSFAGTGQLPFVMSEPKRYKEKTNIVGTFTNYSAATVYANVSLYLHGQSTQVIEVLGPVQKPMQKAA